jgi:c-di-GMP-binding flagellar brake protein YcgR
MKATSDDRRGYKRFQVEGVGGKLLFTTDARVLDMSLDGMAIETLNPLKVGRKYTLRLEEHGYDIPVCGTVVWCSLVKTIRNASGDVQPIYRAGVHFEDLLTTRARDLRQFISENAVISLENRLFGRFRIAPRQSAGLSLEADFRIIQLSRTGMLVETDVAAPADTSCEMKVRLRDFEFESPSRITHLEGVERRGSGRTGRDRNQPLVLLGVEFLDMDPQMQEDLQAFIDEELS